MEDKIDQQRYQRYHQEAERAWEDLCRRCGACCGAFEDPCLLLRRNSDGTCACADYQHRFGPQRTAGGKEFICVPIRQILQQHWHSDHLCAYKKELRQPWAP